MLMIEPKYSSSKRTDAAIRQAFADLVAEYKSIDKVTVKELAERAHITRGTFYTHYSNIYEVASDLDKDLLSALFDNTENLKSLEDIKSHFRKIFIFLRKNERLYRQLLSSEMPMDFVQRIDNMIRERIFNMVHEFGKVTPKEELDTSFFVDGCTYMILRYFRGETKMTLEDIEWYINQKIEELYKNLAK